MPDAKPVPRLFDFPESLRKKYAQLEDVDGDILTDGERAFLEAQKAEARERKKKIS
jgi:hypothetical protein